MKISLRNPKHKSVLIWTFAVLYPNILALAVHGWLHAECPECSNNSLFFVFSLLQPTWLGFSMWASFVLPGMWSFFYLPVNADRYWPRLAAMSLIYTIVAIPVCLFTIDTIGCRLFGPCNGGP